MPFSGSTGPPRPLYVDDFVDYNLGSTLEGDVSIGDMAALSKMPQGGPLLPTMANRVQPSNRPAVPPKGSASSRQRSKANPRMAGGVGVRKDRKEGPKKGKMPPSSSSGANRQRSMASGGSVVQQGSQMNPLLSIASMASVAEGSQVPKAQDIKNMYDALKQYNRGKIAAEKQASVVEREVMATVIQSNPNAMRLADYIPTNATIKEVSAARARAMDPFAIAVGTVGEQFSRLLEFTVVEFMGTCYMVNFWVASDVTSPVDNPWCVFVPTTEESKQMIRVWNVAPSTSSMASGNPQTSMATLLLQAITLNFAVEPHKNTIVGHVFDTDSFLAKCREEIETAVTKSVTLIQSIARMRQKRRAYLEKCYRQEKINKSIRAARRRVRDRMRADMIKKHGERAPYDGMDVNALPSEFLSMMPGGKVRPGAVVAKELQMLGAFDSAVEGLQSEIDHLGAEFDQLDHGLIPGGEYAMDEEEREIENLYERKRQQLLKEKQKDANSAQVFGGQAVSTQQSNAVTPGRFDGTSLNMLSPILSPIKSSSDMSPLQSRQYAGHPNEHSVGMTDPQPAEYYQGGSGSDINPIGGPRYKNNNAEPLLTAPAPTAEAHGRGRLDPAYDEEEQEMARLRAKLKALEEKRMMKVISKELAPNQTNPASSGAYEVQTDPRMPAMRMRKPSAMGMLFHQLENGEAYTQANVSTHEAPKQKQQQINEEDEEKEQKQQQINEEDEEKEQKKQQQQPQQEQGTEERHNTTTPEIPLEPIDERVRPVVDVPSTIAPSSSSASTGAGTETSMRDGVDVTPPRPVTTPKSEDQSEDGLSKEEIDKITKDIEAMMAQRNAVEAASSTATPAAIPEVPVQPPAKSGKGRRPSLLQRVGRFFGGTGSDPGATGPGTAAPLATTTAPLSEPATPKAKQTSLAAKGKNELWEAKAEQAKEVKAKLADAEQRKILEQRMIKEQRLKASKEREATELAARQAVDAAKKKEWEEKAAQNREKAEMEEMNKRLDKYDRVAARTAAELEKTKKIEMAKEAKKKKITEEEKERQKLALREKQEVQKREAAEARTVEESLDFARKRRDEEERKEQEKQAREKARKEAQQVAEEQAKKVAEEARLKMEAEMAAKAVEEEKERLRKEKQELEKKAREVEAKLAAEEEERSKREQANKAEADAAHAKRLADFRAGLISESEAKARLAQFFARKARVQKQAKEVQHFKEKCGDKWAKMKAMRDVLQNPDTKSPKAISEGIKEGFKQEDKDLCALACLRLSQVLDWHSIKEGNLDVATKTTIEDLMSHLSFEVLGQVAMRFSESTSVLVPVVLLIHHASIINLGWTQKMVQSGLLKTICEIILKIEPGHKICSRLTRVLSRSLTDVEEAKVKMVEGSHCALLYQVCKVSVSSESTTEGLLRTVFQLVYKNKPGQDACGAVGIVSFTVECMVQHKGSAKIASPAIKVLMALCTSNLDNCVRLVEPTNIGHLSSILDDFKGTPKIFSTFCQVLTTVAKSNLANRNTLSQSNLYVTLVDMAINPEGTIESVVAAVGCVPYFVPLTQEVLVENLIQVMTVYAEDETKKELCAAATLGIEVVKARKEGQEDLSKVGKKKKDKKKKKKGGGE